MSVQKLNWPAAPAMLPALEQQVHVWCADLDCSPERLNYFLTLLSADEQARAQKFHFDKDRNHFVAARATLRLILSRYINWQPQQLNFAYHAHGKPYLINAAQLQFNLSHAHGIALYAIATEQAVGIDIEYGQRDCDMEGIAKRFFAENEYRQLMQLTGTIKQQAFFNAWVRKEAFLKAHGEGLSYSLNKVEVSLMPHEPAQIIALHDEQQNAGDWSLTALEPLADYAAALVVRGRLLKINTYTFSY